MIDDFSDRNPDLAQLYPAHVRTVSAHYDRALQKSGAGHAVVFSGRPRTVFLDDQHYPFKPNPHFLGWLPLTNLPSSCIVYTPGEKPVLVYYQPRDYWHSVPGPPDGYWADQFDIRIVNTVEDIAQHLPGAKDSCVFVGEAVDEIESLGIERVNPSTVINILHHRRGIKSDYEIQCMRLASLRSARGHVAAEEAFRTGLSEFDIHRAYCGAVGHTDNELPYANIVALNSNGAVLHYTELDRSPPRDHYSFLIDAGAQVHGYSSDITRTYAWNDTRFAELIEAVNRAQLQIVSRVCAGVDYTLLHIETHRILAGVLVDAGLAVGDADTLLETGVTSAFFPHGLGHLLGLQVHDVGGHMQDESGKTKEPPSEHPFLRLTRKLEENMVITIEPGIYVIDLLLDNLRGTPAEDLINWEGVEWLRPFGGIRIEDDVRVTADGCENLTRDAFATIL